MCLRSVSLVLSLLLTCGASAVASAQDEPVDPVTDLVQAEDFGVSLDRIQRQLDRLPDDVEAGRLLRLDYYVQVYGRAPRLELFRGFDFLNSPVAYGTPLHNEMLGVMRSNELYPPAANLNPVLGWAWRALQP